MQAWKAWCSSKDHRCRHHVGIPQKAYVISLPADSEKREYLLPRIQRLGLSAELADGISRDQVNYPTAVSEDSIRAASE